MRDGSAEMEALQVEGKAEVAVEAKAEVEVRK